MSFLAPLFWLAALAVGFPLVFHLIRRTTRQKTPFSSLMFLFPTPPRLTRRSRLEHILLLVLRCCVIGLLAFGFARPFIHKPMDPAPAGAGKRLLVLLDTSASMRRANLWTDAREKLQALLRQTAPADQLALFGFDRELKPLLTFDQWNAAPVSERAGLAMRAQADTSPGWAATRLDSALLRASEILAGNDAPSNPRPGEIVVISDLQEGSHLDLLQGSEWPRNVQVSVELLQPRKSGNASLQVVADSEEGDPKTPVQVRIRVNNAANSRRDQFKIGWAQADGRTFAANPTEIYVPSGQSRVVPLAVPTNASSLSRVILQGDDEDFDNSVFVLPPEAARLSVLFIGADAETDPKQSLYFLKRAFQETRREAVQVHAVKPDQAPPEPELQSAQLVVVNAPLPEPWIAPLRQQAAHGKTLLLVLKNESMAETLAGLAGASQVGLQEVRPAKYAMFGEIDLRDPLFAPFADPRFSDFTRIHFWKYRRFDLGAIPQARALAKFDDGAPALVEMPVEKGRLLVLASGWNPEDSQLALSTKFVPLLYSMLEITGALASGPTAHFVGDAVSLSAGATGSESKMIIPGNQELRLNPGETNFVETRVPGIYTLASTEPAKRFAINLDPAESRTAPLAVEELAHFGVPLKRSGPSSSVAAQKSVRLQNAELENRQKLWRWILISAVGMLLLETWLAGRAYRQAAVAGEPPASEPDAAAGRTAAMRAMS